MVLLHGGLPRRCFKTTVPNMALNPSEILTFHREHYKYMCIYFLYIYVNKWGSWVTLMYELYYCQLSYKTFWSFYVRE